MTSTNVQTNVDGEIFSGTDTWAIVAAGANLSANDTATDFHVGASTAYQIYTGYLSWDTSSIPDTDVVSDVSLQMWPRSKNGGEDFTIEVFAFDWGATLDTGDWRTPAQASALTRVATLSTSTISVNVSWMVFNSDPAFANAINKTGSTRLFVTSSWHRSNSPPTGAGCIWSTDSRESGSTWAWPWLYITHAPAPAVSQQQPLVPSGAVHRASRW